LKTFAAFERMFLKTLNYELLVDYKNLKDFIEIYSDEPNFVMDIVKSCKLAKLEIEKRLKK
jgi:TusA-related sulfurtransferase